MTKVITVTLDPSLERTLVVQNLALGYENRFCQPASLDPAGRGINISRALHRLGKPTTALVLLGQDTIGKAYNALVAEEQFDVIVLTTDTETRNTTVLLDITTHQETHLIEDSTEIDGDDIAAIGQMIEQLAEAGDWVVLAGGLPQGVARDTYAYLTDIAQRNAAKVVLFDIGQFEDGALKAEPELLILSRKDAEVHFNYPIRAHADMLDAARKLQAYGAQEVLVIDREQVEGVLVNGDIWWVTLPKNNEGTRSGAWDALVAGLMAYDVHDKPAEALRWGGAAAYFTMAQIGNQFGTPDDLQPLLAEIAIRQPEIN